MGLHWLVNRVDGRGVLPEGIVVLEDLFRRGAASFEASEVREHVEDDVLVSEDGEVGLLDVEDLLWKVALDLGERFELRLII